MSKFTDLKNWLQKFSEIRNIIMILLMAGMSVLFNIGREMPNIREVSGMHSGSGDTGSH